MSNFPNSLDDDVSLPAVNDNITEMGGEAINALREVAFALEENVGIGAAGTLGSIAERLGVSIASDGTIISSALTSLGLITLPITQDQIIANAQIPESKLNLDHSSQDLYNYITDLSASVNEGLGWISTTGSKLAPHLSGLVSRHTLSHIDVNTLSANYFDSKFRVPRNNTNAFFAIDGMNDELLAHQFADGSIFGTIANVTTNSGSTYPSNYSHTAGGIFINTSGFTTLPQTANDLQLLVDFIDDASIFLLGTRIQNLYSNGISRVSRSSSLSIDGYGQAVVPPTSVVAYLSVTGSPLDSFNTGDDIIEFFPAAGALSSNLFDEQFSLVKVGDIVRINYGTVEVPFIIREIRYQQDSGDKKFIIRIAGKNLFNGDATARIDKPLINDNKYGVLAIAPVNYSSLSLIVGSPRGAQALGLGFNAAEFDASHYMLYLVLYKNGDPAEFDILPGIDVTGNAGATPGLYTLEYIVNATNEQFRRVGYNYRFIAFSYNGDFGIMLADSYNNASFSIMSGVVADDGTYDQSATNLSYPNNVLDVFSATEEDALGIGPNGSNIASPEYKTSYAAPEAAVIATKMFVPLSRNNYYVNGVEKEKLNTDVFQSIDGYGDGYWFGTILSQVINPGPSPSGSVVTTYRIMSDLSTSHLQLGKTIVVQPLGETGIVDFGRFIIQSMNVACEPTNNYTDITVMDAVHAAGISPTTVGAIGSDVVIYFNSDSVGFNAENASDFTEVGEGFKRHFEVYVDQNAYTFTHERARFSVNGDITVNGIDLVADSNLALLNIVKISPKLRGYTYGSVNKIALVCVHAVDTNVITGYLCNYNGSVVSSVGPLVTGFIGDTMRFYDESNVDYIDFAFDANSTDVKNLPELSLALLEIQLFPTLSLDGEISLIATCQMDNGEVVNYLRDARQFGNIGEKDLTTSALNFISYPEKVLHANGVVRGFELSEDTSVDDNHIYLKGGVALVNGKFIQMNDGTVTIPKIVEMPNQNQIIWAVCVNDAAEYQAIPLLDYDVTFSTPNNKLRKMTVYPPFTGGVATPTSSTYNIDATTFSDIVNIRKNLTLLYVVKSTISLVSAATDPVFAISDAKKFVTDIDSNLPLIQGSILGGDAPSQTNPAQGNFISVESIFSWLKFNNKYNGNVLLHGGGTVSGAVRLDFTNQVTIDGGNNSTITFSGLVTIGSNLIFKNCILNFDAGISLVSGLTNLSFENCTINIDQASSATNSGKVFNFTSASHITFDECTIAVSYTAAGAGGTVFDLSSTTVFKFLTSSVSVAFNLTGEYFPGNVFTLTNSPSVIIDLSVISGNFDRGIDITTSNYLNVTDSIISSTFTPTGSEVGIPSEVPVYSQFYLVNSGSGYIYANITSALTDLVIDGVVFNYDPSSSGNNRYSFINIELSTTTAFLSNSRITNCRFYDLEVGGTVEAFRPAIAIINKSPASASTGLQPMLIGVEITSNVCNRIQPIILTSKKSGQYMVYPGLAAENVVVRDNVCGTIGYWVSRSSKIPSISPNVSVFLDKDSGLLIENNNCHYIASMDSTGQYYPVSLIDGDSGVSIATCAYPSGFVTIRNNKSNWIHTGIAYESNASLQILDNVCSAYDQIFIDVLYGDNVSSSTTNGSGLSYATAISVLANPKVTTSSQSPGEGNDSNCIISGNIIQKGYWTFASAAKTYEYGGGVYSQSSSMINDNFISGLLSNALVVGILVGGKNNIIRGNKINRDASIIYAYVAFASYQLPLWYGSGSKGIVTDNIFDSPYTDDRSLSSDKVIVISEGYFPDATNWIVKDNINQTVSIVIPITNAQMSLFITGIADSSTLFLTPQSNTGTAGYKSQVFSIYDIAPANTALRWIRWQQNLEHYIPNGARLVFMEMGLRPFDTVLTTPLAPPGGQDSKVVLYLNKYKASEDATDLDYFTTATSADTNIESTTASATLTGGAINAGSSTLLMTIDVTDVSSVDLSSQFRSGFGIPFSASLEMLFTSNLNPATILLSPLLIKYRW